MLRLFRRNPESPDQLQPCRAEEVDWSRRTLLIFPGSEADLSTAEGEKTVRRSIGLAERMLMLDNKNKKHTEQVQIIAAGWDSFRECKSRLRQFHADPEHYASADAREFMTSVGSRLNTPQLSVLAWSYGSAFVQECANAARERGIPLDQAQALTLGTAVLPETIAAHGLNGAYLFGTNDAVIREHLPAVSAAVQAIGTPGGLTIVPVGEHKMIITAPIPNQLQRAGNLFEFETDEAAHFAKSHTEAVGFSHALIDGEPVPAVAHATVASRCLNNMVQRESLLNAERMVSDCVPLLATYSPAQYSGPHDRMITSALQEGRRREAENLLKS